MKVVPQSRRRPAIVVVSELQELIRTVEYAGAGPVTKLASRFLALTAQRPGMVRRMVWNDLEGIDWCDDAADFGNARYVFPSSRSFHEPMSENAIGYLYNREGYKGRHCPHGWRNAFSTIENERVAAGLKTDEAKAFNRLVIDLMLAHLPKGISETERLYNRAAYLDRRREISIMWANLILDGLPDAITLLDGPRRRYKE